MNKSERRGPWEFVGKVHVDAGLMYLGDPCYVLGEDASHSVESWDDFLDDPVFKLVYTLGAGLYQKGTGVVCSTGYGDGSYDVFIKKAGSRVCELKVVFIEEGEEM